MSPTAPASRREFLILGRKGILIFAGGLKVGPPLFRFSKVSEQTESDLTGP
jgi:hypothetical protein